MLATLKTLLSVHRNPAGIIAAIDAASPRWGQSAEPAVIFDPETRTEIIPLDEPADAAA